MNIERPEIDSFAQARVLIVEDEGIVARDLQHSLRDLGYTVCGTSPSGEDAVVKARTLSPDVVLMDIRLRGKMDGIEAARRIRKQRDVPIVFLTAYADPDTLSRAASIGPYAYVLKPFDNRDLQATLITAMCKHRAFAELDRRVQERTSALVQTEAKYRRLQSVAELGLFALRTPDTDAVMKQAVSLVSQCLGTDLASVFELQRDEGSLTLRAGSGWTENLLGNYVVKVQPTSDTDTSTCAHQTRVKSECDAILTERPRDISPLLKDLGVVSGLTAAIHAPGSAGHTYGIIGAHSLRIREFSESDVGFLQTVANVIATAIMRSAADAKVVDAERVAHKERTRTALAEEAVRARDEFLSVAAHELRTPVAALQLQVESLRELLEPAASSLAPRILEQAERASKTTARLVNLVEDVLNVSRVALGKLELECKTLDLAALAREIVARHEELARCAGCELRVWAPESVRGCWDPIRIEQALTNLLSNALKFGAGKPIDVRAELHSEQALLSVQDRGAGFDPKDAERILQRFERAASPRSYGGLGLGLYIAGQIVNAHGGKLEASSRPGEGATFKVVLPCNAVSTFRRVS